jgi:hypothetical protein
MTDDYFDEAFGRVLGGRPVPAEAAFLVAFANGVHAVATHPARPSAELAELLATGLHAGRDTAGTQAVHGPYLPQPSRPRSKRRTLLGSLAGGLGIVLVSATGAGAAGVLPDPIQDQVSGVVEAVTPFELPHPADDTSVTKKTPATRSSDSGRAPLDGDSPAGPPAQAEFGTSVSEEAKGGGVDGQARDRHQPGAPASSAREQRTTERPTPASPESDRRGTRGSATSPASPASPAPGRPGRP